MKTLHFDIDIQAPRERVYATMLDPEGYRDWTSAFCEGSTYEGRWDVGSRILFLAPNGDGMVSEIAEHRPAEFVSIRHKGMISQGVEDTSSEQARAWHSAYENFAYADLPDGGCRVTVTLDTEPGYEAFMLDTYPRALARLKARCEAAAR